MERVFPYGKILIIAQILWDSFLVEILLVRVICGAQDVSIYTHSWSPSKAMLGSSMASLSPSASHLV